MRTWREVSRDDEFAALFTGTVVKQATTEHPADTTTLTRDGDSYHADMYWHLSNGSILAMELFNGTADTYGHSSSWIKYFVCEAP